MDRYVNAAQVRKAIADARDDAIASEPYGWEWQYQAFNAAILSAGSVPAAAVVSWAFLEQFAEVFNAGESAAEFVRRAKEYYLDVRGVRHE